MHAEDTHIDTLAGISQHGNAPTRERELHTANVEVIGFTNILQEGWYRKGSLGEECDLKLLEERGGHPRKKSCQINTRTFEPKPPKVCKGDVFQR